MSKRTAFDWRKEFVRQHGRAHGEALPSLREMRGILRETVPEAPTATAERGPSQPAPAKASDLPGGEASPGGATVNPSGPAEIIREEGESGAPQIPDPDVDPVTGETEEGPMVEIGPHQVVNERSARALGLVPATSAMGRLVQGRTA